MADLQGLLAGASLSHYYSDLLALGVSSPGDFVDCDDADLAGIGMKKVEISRLRRNLLAPADKGGGAIPLQAEPVIADNPMVVPNWSSGAAAPASAQNIAPPPQVQSMYATNNGQQQMVMPQSQAQPTMMMQQQAMCMQAPQGMHPPPNNCCLNWLIGCLCWWCGGLGCFCSGPLAIYACCLESEVQTLWATGNYALAQLKSKQATSMRNWAAACGTVGLIVAVILNVCIPMMYG